jgi:secreted trypsin-like serine protease
MSTFSFAGIVSYGFGCGRIGYPGIYTNVYYFLDWIKENVMRRSERVGSEKNKTHTYNTLFPPLRFVNYKG